MFIFTNPLKILSIYTINTVIKFMRLSNPELITGLSRIFGSLIHTTFTIARSDGVLPTIKILWALRRSLRNPDLRTVVQIRGVLINSRGGGRDTGTHFYS
jgi:hypothetical protein